MEKIIGSMSVVHQHDEIGQVFADFRAIPVWNFKAKIMVFGIGDDFGVSLGHTAELRFPIAVEDDPVDVIPGWWPTGLPSFSTGSGEANVRRGTGRIIRSQQGFYGPPAFGRAGDAGCDAVAGHVGQFLVHEKRRIGIALAYEARVEPLLGDALELAEEVQLRFLAWITPFGIKK